MLIGGLQKLSLLDYPDKVSAVIFTVGCNLRCGFCHNPELVDLKNHSAQSDLSEKEVLDFLSSRRRLLDGVAITGGEPTLQTDLADFIRRVKEMGFLIKLDTNGVNSRAIEQLIPTNLVNFWAMDVKAPLERYSEIAGRPVPADDIVKSISLIKNSGADYEFRSTLIEGLHQPEDVLAMAQLLTGAKKFVLQKFVPRERLVDPAFLSVQALSDAEMAWLARSCEQWIERCEVR